jgi:hypothetical protein
MTDEHVIPPPSKLGDIGVELVRLERMTAAELTALYNVEFGRSPRSRHRLWLLRALAFRIQERRLGGLSGAARKRLGELMAEIDIPSAGLTSAPRMPIRSKSVSDRQRPNTETSNRASSPSGHGAGIDRHPLHPGTVITKVWRDRDLRLIVRDDLTFELDGVVHRSLSAAAKAVTGQHWNGWVFWFGRGRSNA